MTCIVVLVVCWYIVYHQYNSTYAMTQQQRKNILRYVHHSSERFELPYILLTCTSSSRTKSLEYFIVEIFLYIKIYTCVVCVCA